MNRSLLICYQTCIYVAIFDNIWFDDNSVFYIMENTCQMLLPDPDISNWVKITKDQFLLKN